VLLTYDWLRYITGYDIIALYFSFRQFWDG
jgi:hypothetical protein